MSNAAHRELTQRIRDVDEKMVDLQVEAQGPLDFMRLTTQLKTQSRLFAQRSAHSSLACCVAVRGLTNRLRQGSKADVIG